MSRHSGAYTRSFIEIPVHSSRSASYTRSPTYSCSRPAVEIVIEVSRPQRRCTRRRVEYVECPPPQPEFCCYYEYVRPCVEYIRPVHVLHSRRQVVKPPVEVKKTTIREEQRLPDVVRPLVSELRQMPDVNPEQIAAQQAAAAGQADEQANAEQTVILQNPPMVASYAYAATQPEEPTSE